MAFRTISPRASSPKASGWDCRRLDIRSSLGTLVAAGGFPARESSPSHVEMNVNLADLTRQLPHALPLRDHITIERGSARLRADLTAESGADVLSVDANLQDLIVRDEGRPIALSEPPSDIRLRCKEIKGA